MPNVLILEDNDDLRHVLSLMLTIEGFQVTAFESAEAAEVVLREDNVDVALLDVHLPGRSGDEFGRVLHARFPELPVIFVTADPRLDRLEQAVPGCRVMSKPVDPVRLVGMLRDVH